MKLPRNISGEQLAKVVERLGYEFIRQNGSHAKFTFSGRPQVHLVIPMHRQLKVGTLHEILSSIAEQRGLSLHEGLELLE